MTTEILPEHLEPVHVVLSLLSRSDDDACEKLRLEHDSVDEALDLSIALSLELHPNPLVLFHDLMKLAVVLAVEESSPGAAQRIMDALRRSTDAVTLLAAHPLENGPDERSVREFDAFRGLAPAMPSDGPVPEGAEEVKRYLDPGAQELSARKRARRRAPASGRST